MIALVARGRGPSVNINLSGSTTPRPSIVIIIALTVLSIAPSALILLTGFTRIFIVLGLTRSALGLQNTPPNQVIAGIALFISLFVMAPVLSQIDHVAMQPYLHGKVTATQAIQRRRGPAQDLDAASRRTHNRARRCSPTDQHDNYTEPEDAADDRRRPVVRALRGAERASPSAS